MLKRTIIAFILLLLVTSGSLWWYFRPKQAPPKLNETIRAIPVNAAFIIETKHPKSLKQKLVVSNEFWHGLISLDLFNSLNRQINSIDSLLLSDPKLNDYIDSVSLFISVHPAGVNGYNFLFTIGMPTNVNTDDVDNLIKKGIDNQEIKRRNYDEVAISMADIHEGTLNYAVQKNILLLSFSSMLLEDAIRQLNINNSLLNNATFERLLRAQSETADLHIYLNLNLLPGYLDHFVNNGNQSFLYSLKYFNDWIVLDGTIKTDALVLSGFSASGDSVNNFLDLFKQQEPQHIDVFKIAPDNTVLLLHFGISNFKSYYNTYKKYLESQHKFFDYQKSITQLKSDYHIDIDRQFLDLIEKEMAVIIKSSGSADYSPVSYAVFRTDDATFAFNAIKAMSDSIIKKQRLKRDTAIYRSYSIFHLPIHDFLPILLGQSFEPIKENYFIKLENYLVFANSIDALKNLINDFENGKTMENSAAFNSFSENFSSESNIFLYSSFNRSASMIKGLLDSHYTDSWEKSLSTLKNVEGFALQFTSTATFFYTNAYLKYNANQNQTLTPVWETKLDTTISSEPSVVIDHQTGEKEIFVQDDANTIYLVNKTGKVLWKKNLPERIMSNVYQIDVKKNNKLQLLFNTSSGIYLVDRKGNDVEHFPVKLQSPASNGLNVFDYENNKDYRILLACENKKLYNYNTKGEEVKQWPFEKLEAAVYGAVQHVMIDDKDYVLFIDVRGKIYALDRQGNERLVLKEKFNAGIKSWSLLKGNRLEETQLIACDSSGTIQSINLAGEKQEHHLKDYENTPFFTYLPAKSDSSPQYLLAQDHELSVYSAKNNLLFSYGFKEPVTLAPQAFSINDSTYRVGITLSSTSELYLFNADGVPEKGFPCFGTTAFSIARFTDQSEYILVCGAHNRLVVYSLPLAPQH
jgi:hypothetical protein